MDKRPSATASPTAVEVKLLLSENNSTSQAEVPSPKLNVSVDEVTMVEASSTEPHSFPDDRRYAQLFTRLQRQRRRVEVVMNQDRHFGTEMNHH